MTNLDQFLNDPIFDETPEQKKLNDALFNGPFAKPTKQTFAESMAILSSGERQLEEAIR